MIALGAAAAAAFPSREADADAARAISHGRPLPMTGGPTAARPVAVLDRDGALLALVRDDEERGLARPLVVFAPADGGGDASG